MDNRQLLSRISEDNDEQAFEELFNCYASQLFSVSFRIVRDRELAEEIIEDVFFKLWQIKDRYDDIKNLEKYLYVSVKNLSYDHLRKRGKRQFVEISEDDIMQTGLGADDIYEFAELREQIDLAISKLPTRCKQVFDLVRMNQMSYKEAAAELNISPKTVENQLRIATQKILGDLNEYLSPIEDQMAS